LRRNCKIIWFHEESQGFSHEKLTPGDWDSATRSSRKIFLKTGGFFLQGRGKAFSGIGSIG
jgi:hypothetical protein